ncbi:MAG: adenylate/guanylate cyclase domain-containing protein [Candidatus Binatia bacterium]
MEQPTTSLAIVFADISGSTRLYATIGDQLARQRVARCLSVLTEVTNRYGGTVIKTIGDEVMSTFPGADTAIEAVCAMQEAMVEEAANPQAPLAIHIGLHFGPVLMEAGDVFGDAVNVAARMLSLAKAGQIFTTAQTVEALAPALRANTRHIDSAFVKGKQEEIDIHEVIWQEQEELTRVGQRLILPSALQARLHLRFHNAEIELSKDRPTMTIGRGPQNDFVIPGEFASRLHARIEYRRNKFILLDLGSTNGTFVRTEDGQEAFLRREELLLRGTGMISVGRALSPGSPEGIYFTCK